MLNDIVVTGNSRGQRAFESSVPVTTFSKDDIQKMAPTSTADLLSAVPGVWAESSLSEAHSNVFVRGLPQDGGFTYLSLQEDGIPVYPISTLGFFNADEFVRLDDTIGNVEVIRGGNGPIFASGAAGGIINFISKDPGDHLNGSVKLTVADYGKLRGDVFVGGPISDNWKASVGGYYRRASGPRADEFTSSRGGQVKFRLIGSYDKFEIELFGKYLNDRAPFYLPIPLTNPSNPRNLPGIKVGEYSFISKDLRYFDLQSAAELGLRRFDLADGFHDKVLTGGVRINYTVSDLLTIKNIMRYTDAQSNMRAIFNGGLLTTGTAYAAQRGVAANYHYAATGAVFDPSALIQDAAPWTVRKDFKSFQDIGSFNFDWGSGHSTILGFEFARFTDDDAWSLGNSLLVTTDRNPRRLTLANITDARGFTNYSTFNYRAHDSARSYAAYFSHQWEITPSLRVDAGLRYDNMRTSARAYFPGTVDFDGNPATLYDNGTSQIGAAAPTFTRYKDDSLAESIGFNYEIGRIHGLFGHFTNSKRLRNALDILGAKPSPDKIQQIEVGYKLNAKQIQLFATLFQSELKNIYFNDVLADGSFLRRTAATRTRGLEVDAVLKPRFIPNVDMRISALFQDPIYSRYVGTGFDYTGNQIRRLPKTTLRAAPTLHFLNDRGRLTVDYSYFSKRYSNDSDERVLPAYSELSANLGFDVSDRLTFQLNATNLLNKVALTEGDPRSDPIATGPAANVFKAHDIFGRVFEGSITYKF